MSSRKKTKQANFKFSIEITGIILILIGIIGFGELGPVGIYIKDFGILLFGNYYVIFDIIMFVLGIYMLFMRSLPNFFNQRLIGIYILAIVLLSYVNINYITQGNSLSNTYSSFFSTYKSVIKDTTFTNLSQTGGGAIGVLFSWILVSALSKTGAYIILIVLTIVGIILLFNINFSNVIDSINESFKESKQKLDEARKEHAEEIKKKQKEAEEYALSHPEETIVPSKDDESDKILIHSVEELKNIHPDTSEPVKEDIKKETPVENVPIININTNYTLPTLDEVLNPLKKKKSSKNEEFIKKTSIDLQEVLKDFQITGHVVAVHEGPTVTQFEIAVAAGTRVAKITSISKEIALALAANDVRIEAPIPGKATVGIEIPNREAQSVPIREVIQARRKDMQTMHLPVSLGQDINGNYCITDLAKMPHLLVAGSTGSGKSVCINSFIASLLICKRPDEVKIMLVDPKKVELSNYNGVPHLLCPVVTDPKKASIALQNIVKEMERRYDVFADNKVKNISGYNDMIKEEMKQNPEDTSLKLMPYMLVIIDELADLMLVASKEVEDSIMRITQMARAAGIHLIVATQRPSTDVITGVVKANIPSRIAFAVASGIDSRTILDTIGAEKLLGKGDMLFKPMGQNMPTRIQGDFISDEEIERVIQYVKHEQVAQYDESYTESHEDENNDTSQGFQGSTSQGESEDPLYDEIVDFAIQNGKISASLVQRRFRLGYNRAARVIDELEEKGIIGPPNGSKPREVLVKLDSNNNGIPDNEEK